MGTTNRINDRLRAIVEPLPPGAAVMLPADTVREWLDEEGPADIQEPQASGEPTSWKVLLWRVPDAYRLNVSELAEALDRSADWVYRAVSEKRAKLKGREPLPCKKLDGELVFEAGAVRRWLDLSEEIVNPDRRPRMVS